MGWGGGVCKCFLWLCLWWTESWPRDSSLDLLIDLVILDTLTKPYYGYRAGFIGV